MHPRYSYRPAEYTRTRSCGSPQNWVFVRVFSYDLRLHSDLVARSLAAIVVVLPVKTLMKESTVQYTLVEEYVCNLKALGLSEPQYDGGERTEVEPNKQS